MITISRIDTSTGVYAGQTAQIEDDAACPAGWVRAAAPAAAPGGKQRVWSSGAWILMPAQDMTPDLDALKADALAQIADQRWTATQYFTFDGVRTQANNAISVISARLQLRHETGIPDGYEMSFKLADGEFRSWNRAGEVAFGQALAGHVQGCFNVEATLTDAVAAATTPAAIQGLIETARVSWPA